MFLFLLGCASPVEPAPEPAIAAASATAVAVAPVVEEWRCSTIRSVVIERHVASVVLTADGRFRLDHTNVDPSAGTSTDMEGTWKRYAGVGGDALLLTPDSGLNRRWKGRRSPLS